MCSAGKERVHLFGCCCGNAYYTELLMAFFGLKKDYGMNFRLFGFSIAHEYLGCPNTETWLCGKVTHLNRVIQSSCAWFCACAKAFAGLDVMDFMLQYFWQSILNEIMALEFDMGFCYAILRNLKLFLWYDTKN